MVSKEDGSGNQLYDEYMLINGAFEKIGDSRVDLTDYATKTEVSTAKEEAITTAAGDATTKANQALNDAKSYADGLSSNYATAAQGTKADTALQQADVATGTANGTISVGGDDVAVYGLGSAAYQNTTVFGSASTVIQNTNDITNLKGRVSTLEGNTYIAITEEEIAALFVEE